MNIGNIQNIQPGDTLAIVELDPKTKRVRVCPGVKTYKGRSPAFPSVALYTSGESSQGAFDPDTGKIRPGIYPNPYYMSANPSHIATAKRKALYVARKIDAADARRAHLIKLATPLADFLAYDEKQEVAESLASRLSPAQMKTLAGWLGV